MKVFFFNTRTQEEIPDSQALEASVEQALEIFEKLPQDGGSFLGIINEDAIHIQFRKYNRFMWLIEIPVVTKNGNFVYVCHKDKCKRIIDQLFEGIDPLLLAEFTFEDE